MLNTRDEQHTLSQPTRRRANTANGKECALSCLVVNVNGMRSRNKHRGLFQRLRDLRYSIVVLCETHSTDDRETTRWLKRGQAQPAMGGTGFLEPWHFFLTRSGHLSTAGISYSGSNGGL